MGTRAQILVEGQTCKLYQHWDGSPEGVLPTLIPFVKDFLKRRGWDEQYMVARLVQAFLQDDHLVTGYGVDNEWHGDLEWAYVIRKNGDISVFSYDDIPCDQKSPKGGITILASTSVEDALNFWAEDL